MEKLEEDIGDSERPENKFESQGESLQDSCKTSNDVQFKSDVGRFARKRIISCATTRELGHCSRLALIRRYCN